MATITFQNLFNKFDKKSGMTGTALTEEKEFRDIYGMDVIEIPTNKPVQRVDQEDAVYKTKKEKYKAVIEEVKRAHAKGQPVLVGTITIEVSELLSGMLRKEGIKHNVLNAKYHEQGGGDRCGRRCSRGGHHCHQYGRTWYGYQTGR